jgi:hypothetical protein
LLDLGIEDRNKIEAFVIRMQHCSSTPGSNPLCLECALCCNGVIFADVRLVRRDRAEVFEGLMAGTTSREPRAPDRLTKIPQPCPALEGCRCGIYAERPAHCRRFECLLLKRMASGRLDAAAARRIVRTARERAGQVLGLLRQLGDTDEAAALSIRFRRVKARLEAGAWDDETAERFSQLTLAVHDLNLLLGEAFYPGR